MKKEQIKTAVKEYRTPMARLVAISSGEILSSSKKVTLMNPDEWEEGNEDWF